MIYEIITYIADSKILAPSVLQQNQVYYSWNSRFPNTGENNFNTRIYLYCKNIL